jgi:hypothetical protein
MPIFPIDCMARYPIPLIHVECQPVGEVSDASGSGGKAAYRKDFPMPIVPETGIL